MGKDYVQSSTCKRTSRASRPVEEERAESRSKACGVRDLTGQGGSPTGPQQEEQNRSGDGEQGQPRVQITRPVRRDAQVCSPTRTSWPCGEGQG